MKSLLEKLNNMQIYGNKSLCPCVIVTLMDSRRILLSQYSGTDNNIGNLKIKY